MDDAALKAAYDRVVYERLAPISLGVVIIFVIFTVVGFFTLPQHAILRSTVYDISTVSVFLAIRFFRWE